MVQKSNWKMFNDYEVEPSPGVWDRVVEKLPPPRNRKKAWFIWMAAASFAGLCFLAAYFLEVDVRLKNQAATSTDVTGIMTEKETTSSPLWGQGAGSKPGDVVASSGTSQRSSSTASHSNNASQGSSRTTVHRKSNGGTSFAVSSTSSGANTQQTNTVITDNYPGSGSSGPIALLERIDGSLPSTKSLPPELETNAVVELRPGHSASSWQFAALGSADYCYRTLHYSETTGTQTKAALESLTSSENGISALSTSLTAQYSIGPHFSLLSGVSYFTSGQERDHSQVALSPGTTVSDPMYSVGTSAGNVSGSGRLFDVAYFNNTDSTISVIISNATPGTPSPSFVLEQQFRFVSLPLIAQIQASERTRTPSSSPM